MLVIVQILRHLGEATQLVESLHLHEEKVGVAQRPVFFLHKKTTWLGDISNYILTIVNSLASCYPKLLQARQLPVIKQRRSSLAFIEKGPPKLAPFGPPSSGCPIQNSEGISLFF